MFSVALARDGVAATVVAITEACVASLVEDVAATSSVLAVAGRPVAEARIAEVATAEVRVALPVDDVVAMSSVVFTTRHGRSTTNAGSGDDGRRQII